MNFVSVNSERNTTKNCALFLLACAMADISKERKRENWLREKSVDAFHLLFRPQSLLSISLQMPVTRRCLVLKRCPLYSV